MIKMARFVAAGVAAVAVSATLQAFECSEAAKAKAAALENRIAELKENL